MNSQTENPSKKCLLIIPRHFYSFEKHIRGALEKIGYEVVVSNDEYPVGTLGKIIGKLQIPLIFPVTRARLKKEFLQGRSYDLALIFKGRGMSPGLIQDMRQSAKRIIGYNWDSFRLNRSPLQWLTLVDRYYTFDYRDADEKGLPIVELFSSAPTETERANRRYQFSTISRNHSRRIDYIDRVLSILKPESAFISIYEQNVFTFTMNFLRSPRLYVKYWKNISFKPLDYAKYSEVMKNSEFTIDYAHETQTGITMRCFEAINMKTKIVTNNSYIARSRSFAEGDYIVFEDDASPEELQSRYARARELPYASSPRTISDFIGELVV